MIARRFGSWIRDLGFEVKPLDERARFLPSGEQAQQFYSKTGRFDYYCTNHVGQIETSTLGCLGVADYELSTPQRLIKQHLC